MAVEFLQAAANTTDGVAFTFSSQNLGSAAGDRHIIVCVMARQVGSARTLSCVTVAGVTATINEQMNSVATNVNTVAVATAAVPTGTSGDVVVTFTGGTMVNCTVALYRATGLGSATPHQILESPSANAPPTANLDIPAGGFAVAVASTASSDRTCTWTGLTEDHDAGVETFHSVSTAHDEFVSEQTDLTITADFTADNETIGIFASWEGAGGGESHERTISSVAISALVDA